MEKEDKFIHYLGLCKANVNLSVSWTKTLHLLSLSLSLKIRSFCFGFQLVSGFQIPHHIQLNLLCQFHNFCLNQALNCIYKFRVPLLHCSFSLYCFRIEMEGLPTTTKSDRRWRSKPLQTSKPSILMAFFSCVAWLYVAGRCVLNCLRNVSKMNFQL